MKKLFLLSLAILIFDLPARLALGADTGREFAKWEKEIAAYERADATNPPPPQAVEFVGSSTIRKWITLAQDFPGQPVFNRGFGGSQITDSTHFAPRVIFPYAPRAIFFHAGGNDLAAGKTPEQVFPDFKEFIAGVQAKLPATEIYFISLRPSIKRWKQHGQEQALNQLIKDFVQNKPHLNYIETYDLALGADGLPRPELFAADNLHFNAAGYQRLAARVRPFIDKK